MRSLVVVLALSGLLLGCSGAGSTVVPPPPIVPTSKWPTPFTESGSLGAALEPAFTRMLQRCGVDPLDADTARTSIPSIVRAELRLEEDQIVTTQDRDAVERILRYMFPSPDLESYKPGETKREFRGSSLRIGGLPTPIDLSSSTLYYQNCSTVLAAAVDAGLNVPLLSIKAAAEANVQEKSGLGLVDGTFRSPLATGLLKSAPFQIQFPLLLEVWQWYLDNPDAIDNPPYYIDQFVGVAQIDYTESATSQRYELNAEGGGSFGTASLGFRGNLESGVGTRLSRKGFTTHVYVNDNGAENITFEALPSPSRIVEVFEKADPRIDNRSSTVLQSGITHSLVFSMSALPAGFCESFVWDNDPDGLTGHLTRESIEWQKIGTDDGICVFRFAYQPGDAVFSGDNLLEGTIKLRSASSYALNDHRLTLQFPVRLPTTDEPRLRQVGSPPDWAGTSSRLMWEIPVEILTSRQVVGGEIPVELKEPSLHCGSGSPLPADYKIIPGERSVFTLELSSPRPGSLDGRTDGSEPTDNCDFSAIAIIPVDGADEPIRRPLTVNVPMPVTEDPQATNLTELLAVATGTIDVGSRAEGELTSDDIRMRDDGSWAQVWALSPSRDAAVSIRLSSDDFDPYLIVVGPDREYRNDDESDDSFASLVELDADAGAEYLVIVNTIGADRFGAFTIEVGERGD